MEKLQPITEALQSCIDIEEGLLECQTFNENDDEQKASELALLRDWRLGLEAGHYTDTGRQHVTEGLNRACDFLDKMRELQGEELCA